MSVHGRIERAFAAWGRIACRERVWVLLTMFALTAVCVLWIPQMRFDNSTQGFLHADDPARVAYEDFRIRFGQDEFVLVAVRPPNLFAPDFLERLRDFHAALEEEVPHLEDVTSMLNVRSTRGKVDELIVEDLFEQWPETREQLAAIRDRALGNPLYRNLLFSSNYTYTTLTVRPVLYSEVQETDPFAGFEEDGGEASPPLSDEEGNEFLDAVQAVMDRFESPTFELQVVGSSVTNRDLNEALQKDVVLFVCGGSLVMACILFMLFRTIAGVVLPLLVVVLSLLSSAGVMVMMDIPGSAALQVVPILLIAVGVCDAVHILTIVNQKLGEGMGQLDSICFALGHSGLAVLMTSLTTAAGFMSFISAELAPVSNLGVVAPIGIMFAFLYTVTLLPALLSLWPLRRPENPGERALERELGQLLAKVGGLGVRRPWLVLSGAAACLLLALGGLAQLSVSQNTMRWFPKMNASRASQELMDREFRGTMTLEVILDTGEPEGLYDPEMLRRIDRAADFALSYERAGISAGKVLSILDVLKETNRALNANDPAHYAIPDRRELIAQELLLFENAGSDDLEELVDTQFRVARLSLRVPMADAIQYQEYVAGLDEGLRRILGDDVGIEMTGIMRLLTRAMVGVVYSMIDSYLTAFLVITPLMVLLIGALRQGLLAMVPNLLPVFLTLGMMGWLGIPIDMSSMLVGGIIIGLAVDDTIHFMHKFQRYYAELGDAGAAIQAALRTTGAALLFTTLILGSGFVVMEFAYMRNASQFGQLACFATVAAFAADVLVAPALLVLVGEPGKERTGGRVEGRLALALARARQRSGG